MYKPLVISKFYLQEKSTTGQIQRFFWEYLVGKGFHPTVICSKVKKGYRTKDTLRSRIKATYESQSINQFFKLLRHTIYQDIDKNPDTPYYSWAKLTAIKKANEEALSGNYDYIHSTNHPVSCHLIALEAKKKSGLPWIASFYDPWYMNPLRPIKKASISEKDKQLEALVAENADIILHTNQAIYQEWVERYGEKIKQKMFVLPLVFNMPKREDHSIMGNSGKFVISHIGNLYLDRTSVDFLKAVRLLLDKHPELKNVLLINYLGTVTPKDKEYVKDSGLSDIINFVGSLNEAECCDYYEKSNMFLAVDAKSARNIFFPSKILKYFYYGKPILGLTPANSALQYELEKSGNYVFRNEDYEQVAIFLYNSILNQDCLYGFDKEYWRNFTMDKVYPEYLKIVKRLFNSSVNYR